MIYRTNRLPPAAKTAQNAPFFIVCQWLIRPERESLPETRQERYRHGITGTALMAFFGDPSTTLSE
ncbi:hypothetical protein CKO_03388 [Citrobacter koseri ATCC BAA-895]|uniref:Uncharacterized protein n=1 Tax=Citrobacter koseri (strain ATCC BAA-895 / CDC 4225-83 / SGSC4696) TaxID=290338 RepID=A8ALV8_CITK8|nr:hypothetical protein CKO_03388 [Citrobacter koseri ATCC BAA-895]